MKLENFIFNMLKDKKGGFFIECGAHDGITASNCIRLELELGWTGINLEANSIVFGSLLKNRPRSNNINMALSNISNDELDFIRIGGKDFNINCLKTSLPLLRKRLGKDDDIRKIFSISYPDLIARQMVESVDFLSLDVEGHEQTVIDGMVGSKALPEFICVEFSHSDKSRLHDSIIDLGYCLVTELDVDFIFRKKHLT